MNSNPSSAEYIHSCYIFSALTYNTRMDHPHKEDPNFAEGLLERLKHGQPFSWEELESGFPKVIERTKKYAEKRSLDYRSRDAALGYWLIDHNRIIREGQDEYQKMSKSQKEACKTRLGKVTQEIQRVEGSQKIEFEYDGGKRAIINFIYDPLKPGDLISAHEWIVTLSKIDPKEFDKYLSEMGTK
jgi:hypothetical protein